MICPVCQNPVRKAPSPNGGTLYVAEGFGTDSEFYDTAIPYECITQDHHWYMGGEEG